MTDLNLVEGSHVSIVDSCQGEVFNHHNPFKIWKYLNSQEGLTSRDTIRVNVFGLYGWLYILWCKINNVGLEYHFKTLRLDVDVSGNMMNKKVKR